MFLSFTTKQSYKIILFEDYIRQFSGKCFPCSWNESFLILVKALKMLLHKVFIWFVNVIFSSIVISRSFTLGESHISISVCNASLWCKQDDLLSGGPRFAATSKMERFVIIVNSFQPLTIITKRSILDVAADLDPPLLLLSTICVISRILTKAIVF